MNIDINTSIDKLLELWTIFSHKLYHKQSVTWEDLYKIRKISDVLGDREIIVMEVCCVEEKKYTLRYSINGREFVKEILIDL